MLTHLAAGLGRKGGAQFAGIRDRLAALPRVGGGAVGASVGRRGDANALQPRRRGDAPAARRGEPRVQRALRRRGDAHRPPHPHLSGAPSLRRTLAPFGVAVAAPAVSRAACLRRVRSRGRHREECRRRWRRPGVGVYAGPPGVFCGGGVRLPPGHRPRPRPPPRPRGPRRPGPARP